MNWKDIVYAKKSALGYRATANINDATNVIITLQQYNDCCKEIDELGNQIILLNDCLEKRKRELKLSNATIDQYYNETLKLEKQLEESNSYANDIKKKYDKINVVCKSFLRQCRERSNQDKGQFPKKKHTGYSLVISNPKDYQYTFNGSKKRTMIFETVLQTPYPIDFTYQEVYELVDNDLDFGEDSNKLLDYMGAYQLSKKNRYEEILDIYADEEIESENIFFNQNIRMNGRDGYWELTINHTRPLLSPPSIMRFPPKKKKSEKK